jgi:murein DD-endopeptidase MepM/ murein hydrolase activator NlpD
MMTVVFRSNAIKSSKTVCAVVVALGIALFVSGCSRHTPAPLLNKAGAVGVNPTKVIAQVGDTVYAIANRFGVPVRDLIQTNFLLPPYTVRPGQLLKLPKPGEHVVTSGDTLYGISRHYGIDMTSLARINRMRPPYTILVGQKLRLPANAKLTRVASNQKPVVLKPPVAKSKAKQQAAVKVPGKKPPIKKAPRTKSPRVPERSGGRFAWPLRGPILSKFGAKKGGLYNDGINIAAKRGQKVHAAENGVVAYAGNELRGFGNLLLIRHKGGWMTAYAHADKLLVKRGQTVKRQQVIGIAGSSGSVAKPQVHFEIRKGSRAVNPLKYLATANLRKIRLAAK